MKGKEIIEKTRQYVLIDYEGADYKDSEARIS